MELRKIQLTGGSSFTVTLPKEWVTQAKLGAGDVVGFAAQEDGSLAIYPGAARASAPARHDIEHAQEESEEATFRRIIAAYLSGYDVIAVRSRRPLPAAARRALRQAAKRIIGLEVVEEEASVVVLQDFLDPREFHMDKGLRRMQALTRAMQDDALRAFTEPIDDFEALIAERDDEVDRLYWMVNKQYHAILRDPTYAQKMGLNASQALNHLLVARVVERTADHAIRIARNAQAMRGDDIGAKLAHKIEKQARKAVQLFAEALTAFHKQDVAAANRIIGEATAFKSGQDAVIRESLSLGGESMLHVAYALESAGRTAAYAADIAETAINHRVAMDA
ncbi:MAG TPA: PhoU domain-containing protein [Candidatus Thermoplasmatota archaeon]|nr:PhoU domain-containing protein [Candidatus Thermoplasmatota archaeon]